jgi:Leucine-rich repeat (LRR) protein
MKKLTTFLLIAMVLVMAIFLSACFLLKPQPPILTATAVNAFSIMLSWKGDGTTFTIYRALAQSGVPFNPIATTTAHTYTDNGLSSRTTYYYKVVAKNQFGVSDPSNVASATTKFFYRVSGWVEDQYAYGIADVTIEFSGGFSPATTDQYGQWSKNGLSGTVIVTPKKVGWTFAPASATVASTNNTLYFEGIPTASVVIFPDPVLNSIVRSQIGKPFGDIYPSDLTPIATIQNNWPTSDASKIANLEGIQYCVNLRTLEIVDNDVATITQLASLTHLQTLNLWSNNVSDLRPIQNLTQIKNLYITYDPIPRSNWAFLKNWTWLEELGIGGIGLTSTDITFLSKFSSLTYLQLFNNQITDVSPIASLTNLKVLLINGNAINDLSPVSGLVNLYDLNIGDINTTDLTPLRNLTNLKIIGLFSDNLTDISALASLTALQSIALEHNAVEDLSPLENLSNLQGLDLSYNNIRDISPLVRNNGINAGDYLDLRENYLDLTPPSTALNDIETLKKRGVTVKYEPQK